MMMKAVIDRFEGKYAIITLEDERRFDFPRKQLPKGARSGTWLQVEVDGDEIQVLTIDEAETQNARARIADKLAQLRRGEHLDQSDP